jgi:membrane-associated phospholipid phosphatase
MSRGLRAIEARLLPRGRTDALRQLVLVVVAYAGYQLVRGAIDGRGASAFWNADRVVALERHLHVFVEPAVQGWTGGSRQLTDVLAWLYVDTHFVVTVSAIVFIYVFRNESFYFVRNMCMVAMGIALVGYVLFPTAPPRLLPHLGVVDSVAVSTGIKEHTGPIGAFVNLYAAIPSMHVCFALMVGWPLASLVRPRPLKVAWALYPVLVAFVVVATGNHFIVDVVAGAATAGVSALVAQWLLARARPAAWAFHPARAGVTS